MRFEASLPSVPSVSPPSVRNRERLEPAVLTPAPASPSIEPTPPPRQATD